MAGYILSTCSTVDLPKQYLDRRNIKYLCFRFSMGKREYIDDFGYSMSHKEFYNRIRDGAMPTTAQIDADEYADYFRSLLDRGADVLHLAFSSGLSKSADNARIACRKVSEEYPGQKLYVADTLCASSGFGLLLDAVYEKKQVGLDITALYNWVGKNKLRVNHWIRVDDLSHLSRGGRISGTSAAIGNMLQIKPIIDINFEGKLIPRGQATGGKKSLDMLVDKMIEHAENGLDYSSKVFVCHSSNMNDASYVAEMIEAKFPKLRSRVMINKVGPVIGAHTGVGTVALFFFGDRRVDGADGYR